MRQMKSFSINEKYRGIPAINTSRMSRKEWQEFRSSYKLLGGSELGTVIGLDEYKSPLALWREKIGYVKSEVKYNKYMAGGHVDEAGIITRLAHYDDNTGDWVANYANEKIVRCVEQIPYTLFPDHMPWVALNIDGAITDDPFVKGFGVAECKTIGTQTAKKYIGGLPPKYIAQLVAYMDGTGADFGRFAFLDTDRDFYSILLTKDQENYKTFSSILHERCAEFFQAIQEGIDIMAGELTLAARTELFLLEQKYSSVLKVDNTLSTAKFLNDAQKEMQEKNELKGNLFDAIIAAREEARKGEEEYSGRKIHLENTIRAKMQQLSCVLYVGSNYKISYNGRLTITVR